MKSLDGFRSYFASDVLYHLVVASILFIGTLVIGWILKRFFNTVVWKLISKTRSDLDDLILGIILDRITWIAVVAGAYLATEEVAKTIYPSQALATQFLGYAQGIIFVSFVLVITFVVIRIADASVRYAIESHARRTSSRFNEALFPLIRRLINIVIALIAVIITLDHFGQDVSSLVVSLGVGSLAIALAAQDTIANMIGGFVIMLDRPFRVGDRIQLPSGETGDVYEIGIRSTKIQDFDSNLIIIPNSDLVKSRVVNFSYPEEMIRVTMEVGVAYGTRLDDAKSIMTDIARQHPDVLRDPPPEVYTVALADSSVNLRLVARTDDYKKKFLIETALRERVYAAFMGAGIQIPFPQRVVRIVSSPDATS